MKIMLDTPLLHWKKTDYYKAKIEVLVYLNHYYSGRYSDFFKNTEGEITELSRPSFSKTWVLV